MWRYATTSKNEASPKSQMSRTNINTKIMTRLLISLIIIILVSSCKKEKEVEITESEINYEINGAPFQFKSKTDITFSFIGIIQTTGQEKPTNWLFLNTPNMLIRVKDFTKTTPINTGIYSGITYDSNGNIRGVELWYSNGIKNYESSFINPDTEVKITSISRNGVKGTFRGTVISNQDTLKFENGTFSIYSYKN
jgi:hypothetical protein